MVLPHRMRSGTGWLLGLLWADAALWPEALAFAGLQWSGPPSRLAAMALHSSSSPPSPSFLKQQPGESSSAFLRRIQELASDPHAFERAALGADRLGDNAVVASSNTHLPPGNGTSAAAEGEQEGVAPRRGGYQRAEDWDREQQERSSRGGGSWEDRVQFDGLRHGNRVRQNDILIRSLKVW